MKFRSFDVAILRNSLTGFQRGMNFRSVSIETSRCGSRAVLCRGEPQIFRRASDWSSESDEIMVREVQRALFDIFPRDEVARYNWDREKIQDFARSRNHVFLLSIYSIVSTIYFLEERTIEIVTASVDFVEPRKDFK